MRNAAIACLILAPLLPPDQAAAQSRDLGADQLQQMCAPKDGPAKEQMELGCQAFLDGFVRGLTRGRGCPQTDYQPILAKLVDAPADRLRGRLADEALEALVAEAYPCPKR